MHTKQTEGADGLNVYWEEGAGTGTLDGGSASLRGRSTLSDHPSLQSSGVGGGSSAWTSSYGDTTQTESMYTTSIREN